MTKKKTPKPYNWDSKIVSALRRVWRFSDTRKEVINAAKSASNPKNVVCAICSSEIDKRTAVVDHVVPCVALTGFDSWDAYIERLKSPNLRILCESCHNVITKEQNAIRRANRPKKTKAKREK